MRGMNKQEFEYKLETLKNELLDKGLEPGHVELLRMDMQAVIGSYAALDAMVDIIEKNKVTVKELEVFNSCRKKFFVNPAKALAYIEIIRKYDVTTDKIELVGKLGISISGKVRTLADFESVMKIVHKYPIKEVNADFLKKHFVFETLVDFEKALEIFSKHDLNKDQMHKLEGALLTGKLVFLNNIAPLETIICNIEKYNQPTQPTGAWVWEKLGLTYEVKAAEPKVTATDVLAEINRELVPHTDPKVEFING